jgi:hypothetical protein
MFQEAHHLDGEEVMLASLYEEAAGDPRAALVEMARELIEVKDQLTAVRRSLSAGYVRLKLFEERT